MTKDLSEPERAESGNRHGGDASMVSDNFSPGLLLVIFEGIQVRSCKVRLAWIVLGSFYTTGPARAFH